MKLSAQVDMIEFKDYGEIDLNENPVVSLDCGHFFTAETLDGKYARGGRPIISHGKTLNVLYGLSLESSSPLPSSLSY